MWAGHTWCKQWSIVKQVTEEDPIGKKTIKETKIKMRRLCEKNMLKR